MSGRLEEIIQYNIKTILHAKQYFVFSLTLVLVWSIRPKIT